MSFRLLRDVAVLCTVVLLRNIALAVVCLLPLTIAGVLSILWALKATDICGKNAGPWARQNVDIIGMVTVLLSLLFAGSAMSIFYKSLYRVPLLGSVLRFSDTIIERFEIKRGQKRCQDSSEEN